MFFYIFIIRGKKIMEKIKKMIRRLKEKFTFIGTTAIGTLILAESRVFADSNTDSIDSFISFACDWLTKIRRCNSTCRWSYVCVADGKEKMQKGNQEDL